MEIEKEFKEGGNVISVKIVNRYIKNYRIFFCIWYKDIISDF